MLKFIGVALLLFPILRIVSEVNKRGRIRSEVLAMVANFSKFYLEEVEKYKSSPEKIINKYRAEYSSNEIVDIAERATVRQEHPWACILSEEEKKEITGFFSQMGSSCYDTEVQRARTFRDNLCEKAHMAEEKAVKNGKVYPLLFVAFAAGVLILIL